MSFKGKIAAVVGGASGVGAEVAKIIASEGGEVVILDIQKDLADSVAEEIRGLGGSASVVRVDVTSPDSVEAATGEVLARHDRVDVLATTVGWNVHSFFMDQGEELWEKILQINLMGQVRLVHAFLPTMKTNGGGSIVVVSSDAGRVGTNGETVYAAAKAGVIGFTKSLAREVTRFGIRINCVSPGPTDTPLFRSATESQPHIADAMVKLIPMKRMAKPEEQANAIVFLASDAASYITGQTLSVNGGLNML
ncbi:MAG TPA: SDR family NAD(P)-dependent oxidoreductase [Streptosporangiaceae bacterium]